MGNHRFLIVLDLNGTILQRLKSDVILRHLKAKNPEIKSVGKILGRPIICRPGSTEFLEKLLRIADVAVWTSAQSKNAIPMVMMSFAGLLSKDYYSRMPADLVEIYKNFQDNFPLAKKYGRGRLQFIWTQKECDEIPSKYTGSDKNYKPDFRKDLGKIWQAFPGMYGP